jgi:hypothetical protein
MDHIGTILYCTYDDDEVWVNNPHFPQSPRGPKVAIQTNRVVDPDPYSIGSVDPDPESGSRRAKMTHKRRQ